MGQLLVNILIGAAQGALTAYGLSLIYRVSRCVDFAQGVFYTVGAYLAYTYSVYCGLPLPLSIGLSSVSAAGIGGLVDGFLYKAIRNRTRSPLGVLIASLGVVAVVQGVISLVFQDITRSLPRGSAVPGFLFLGGRVTESQITTAVATVVIAVGIWWVLKYTRFGLKMRAVSENRTLAAVVGIPSTGVIWRVAVIGSGLSGLAGALVSLETDMHPLVGNKALLSAVLITLLAGPGRVWRILLVALVLAGVEEGVGMHLSFLWKETAALLVVLAVLVLYPYGAHRKTLEAPS